MRTAAAVPNLFVLRNAWCWKVKGKRYTLCPLTDTQLVQVAKGKKPTPTAEQQKALIARLIEEKPSVASGSMRLDQLCNRFLADRDGEVVERKLYQYRLVLSRLCEVAGGNRLDEITPAMVRQFVKSQTGWRSLSTKRNAYKTILQAMNFAVTNKILATSPLTELGQSLKKEVPEVKREVLLTPEQEQAILDALSPAAARVAKALRATGLRPADILGLRKAHVIQADRIKWHLPKHKKSKTEGGRVVDHLTPEIQAMTLELLKDQSNKTEYLFVTDSGRPWTGYNFNARLATAIKRVQKKHPELHLPHFTALAYRHTMITRSVLQNIPFAVIANWVGNSPSTIERHYSHVSMAGYQGNFVKLLA